MPKSLDRTTSVLLIGLWWNSALAWSEEAVQIDGIRFKLAENLRIEKVASEPLIKWPIVADWDLKGNLVVAESGGVGWPIVEHNKKKLHKIVRLIDRDRDGSFDQRIVAADGLAFPEGVLCIGNDILVSAPPVIWKLTDNDEDGVCEHREVWFDAKTVTNCANDLHGPYLGRDGWIYWCKGAFGQQSNQLLDGRTFDSSAAHVYRRQFEGGAIEPIVSGGMDNPVEVAFIPEGEKFFTSTFLQHPGNGLRDGIAHAVYGGLFGKDHSVLEGHVRTGPLMPIMTQLGPAAPSGLICLESDRVVRVAPQQPDARTLLAALFNLHKVTAHTLTPDGASYRTIDQDLVVADRVDFHPTDVIEDADGSLLILDTGGWYDLCCPTSRINQKTASGGIYRVTRDAGDSTDRQMREIDWSSVDDKNAVNLLFDGRPWIRRHAEQLTDVAGDAAVPQLAAILTDPRRPIDQRLVAQWALCRIGTATALQRIVDQLSCDQPQIIQAACHALALHRHAEARESLEALLDHDSLHVRRVASQALGRIGDIRSAKVLLASMDQVGDDRHLQHSLIHALIDLSRVHPPLDVAGLANSDDQLLAALIVHDQSGRLEQLDRSRVLSALKSNDRVLCLTAAKITSKRKDWATDSLDMLNGLWRVLDQPDSVAADVLAEIAAGWQDVPAANQQITQWYDHASDGTSAQQMFLADNLDTLCREPMTAKWISRLSGWLSRADGDVQRKLCQKLPEIAVVPSEARQWGDALVALSQRNTATDRPLSLLTAIPIGYQLADKNLEESVIEQFTGADPKLAATASKVLVRLKPSQMGAERLVRSLADVSPQSLMTAIEAVHRHGDARLDRQMLQQLPEIPAARTLPQQFLENLYKSASQELRTTAATVTRALLAPSVDIQAAVDQMLGELEPGDPVHGLQIFRGNKAACSACHRMGYIGNDTGPELTRIGASRTPAALLEAILFPSARLEQSFQSSRLLTVDGQVHNGLIKRRTDRGVELQINADRILEIDHEQIERIEPSNISVMPSGLVEVLSKGEIADLMALLKSAK